MQKICALTGIYNVSGCLLSQPPIVKKNVYIHHSLIALHIKVVVARTRDSVRAGNESSMVSSEKSMAIWFIQDNTVSKRLLNSTSPSVSYWTAIGTKWKKPQSERLLFFVFYKTYRTKWADLDQHRIEACRDNLDYGCG
eukprot:CFRG6917T1